MAMMKTAMFVVAVGIAGAIVLWSMSPTVHVSPSAQSISIQELHALAHLEALTAHALGLELHVLHASTERELDAAFAGLSQLRVGGLVIGPDSFLVTRSERLAELALEHALPAVFEYREPCAP
jgi:hypothetical protein